MGGAILALAESVALMRAGSVLRVRYSARWGARPFAWLSGVPERADPGVEVAAVVAADRHLDDLDPAVGVGEGVLELGERLDPPVGVRVAAHRLARSTPWGVPNSRS